MIVLKARPSSIVTRRPKPNEQAGRDDRRGKGGPLLALRRALRARRDDHHGARPVPHALVMGRPDPSPLPSQLGVILPVLNATARPSGFAVKAAASRSQPRGSISGYAATAAPNVGAGGASGLAARASPVTVAANPFGRTATIAASAQTPVANPPIAAAMRPASRSSHPTPSTREPTSIT